MRQDLTVQHVRNALSVRVYESHGRASLEYGDLAEFNQVNPETAITSVHDLWLVVFISTG